jgi:hypothetical protein
MKHYIRDRSLSATTVTFVLLMALLLEGGVTYTLTSGALPESVSMLLRHQLQATWFAARSAVMAAVLVLWALNRTSGLFRALIVMNGMMTLGLLASAVGLFTALFGVSARSAGVLWLDVVFMAVANVLVFSIWYWIIDPPGIDEARGDDEPWDFLFPQRADALPGYEDWRPRYTDYLYVAFTTSLAFSPTDTLPLTRRAKLLMLLQATISTVTIVVIAGTAINNL